MTLCSTYTGEPCFYNFEGTTLKKFIMQQNILTREHIIVVFHDSSKLHTRFMRARLRH